MPVSWLGWVSGYLNLSALKRTRPGFVIVAAPPRGSDVRKASGYNRIEKRNRRCPSVQTSSRMLSCRSALSVDPARHRAATPIDAKQTVYLCEVTDRVEKKKIKEEEKEKER